MSHHHHNNENHHGHSHHHHGEMPVAHAANTAFVTGIVLNMGYVIFQGSVGLYSHSMVLLSDAGHNLSDVASLVLSLLAFRLAKKKATQQYTYGYKKGTIIAALMNAVILLVTVGLLAVESVHHLLKPVPVEGGTVAWVSALGIVVNAGSAFLFFGYKEKDLNMKSAYLHLMADAAVSVGVVIAGLVIKYTSWYWLDGSMSLVILATIIWATWSLMMNSLRLALDAVPGAIDIAAIEKKILATPGIVSMHHTHIWAMSTTENALTTHIVLQDGLGFEQRTKLLAGLKHMLLHAGIHHATIETEAVGQLCGEDTCNH